jgi:hypothetical protein
MLGAMTGYRALEETVSILRRYGREKVNRTPLKPS